MDTKNTEYTNAAKIYGKVMSLEGYLRGMDETPTNYIDGGLRRKKVEQELIEAIKQYQKTIPTYIQEELGLNMGELEKLINARVVRDREFFADICESSGIFKR